MGDRCDQCNKARAARRTPGDAREILVYCGSGAAECARASTRHGRAERCTALANSPDVKRALKYIKAASSLVLRCSREPLLPGSSLRAVAISCLFFFARPVVRHAICASLELFVFLPTPLRCTTGAYYTPLYFLLPTLACGYVLCVSRVIDNEEGPCAFLCNYSRRITVE